jgi:hypothetical protein
VGVLYFGGKEGGKRHQNKQPKKGNKLGNVFFRSPKERKEKKKTYVR